MSASIYPGFDASRYDYEFQDRCADALSQYSGMRCPDCGGKTDADIDEGQIWIRCIAYQNDEAGNQGCGWRLTEMIG